MENTVKLDSLILIFCLPLISTKSVSKLTLNSPLQHHHQLLGLLHQLNKMFKFEIFVGKMK